jgi:HD superfamily phosphohydrolase
VGKRKNTPAKDNSSGLFLNPENKKAVSDHETVTGSALSPPPDQALSGSLTERLEEPQQVATDGRSEPIFFLNAPSEDLGVVTFAPVQSPDQVSVESAPRRMPERKIYQDEIYGTKELSPLAVALIDTPEFQRLGHIYQLGMTHHVFRGGNHRRLDHCIGTYFMVRTLMRRLVQNHARFFDRDSQDFKHPGSLVSPRFYFEAAGTSSREQSFGSVQGRWRGLVEIVSAAALLHDLGHIPSGHTLEDEFSIFEKHDGLGSPRLFEFLYGPRDVASGGDDGTILSRHFGPIDASRLPRPRADEQRVALPWTFEEGTYVPFLDNRATTPPKGAEATPLANAEIRDLIYLLLSFKETIRCPDDGACVKFTDELVAAKKGANGDRDRLARLQFISDLLTYYSMPCKLSQDEDKLPLFHPFMADLISNTICSDLLDYLVRDGRRLQLEIRNNPRLQRYLVIARENTFGEITGDFRVVIRAVHRTGLPRRDTVSDLLDLMRERYRFAEVVYYHPKKAAISTMLAKAMEICGDKGPRDKGGVYPAPWSSGVELREGPPHVVHVGDEDLLAYLSSSDDKQVKALARRIRYRDEYRLLFTLDHEAAGDDADKITSVLRASSDAERKNWEKRLSSLVETRAAHLDAPPFLIYCPSSKMQAKEVAARVELEAGKRLPLNRCSDGALKNEIASLIKRYHHLWRLYIFVHPALTMGGNEADDVLLFGAVVDTFCERFGVELRYRERGSRFKYLPIDQRIRTSFDEWKISVPTGIDPDKVVWNTAVGEKSLWGLALGRPDSPFAVDQSELTRGFNLVLTTIAASQVEAPQRQAWPKAVNRLADSREWGLAQSAPADEQARMQSLDKLISFAEKLASPGSKQRRSSWDGMKDSLASLLGTGRGAVRR